MLRPVDDRVPVWLTRILVCPVCHSDLEASRDLIRCVGCESRFAHGDPRVIGLGLSDKKNADKGWRDRQRDMTAAYQELVADRDHAVLAYRSDYGPLAPLLATYTGQVVDLGGGNGIARHWLPEETRYVSVDPTTDWLDQSWNTLADAFPCLARPFPYVVGVAEQLPFAEEAFDGGLSIWSLNHVMEPARALRDAARVIKTGRRLLLVLDDIPPSWPDVLIAREPPRSPSDRLRLALKKLGWLVTGAPLQPDHLRLSESEIERWARPKLVRTRRLWIGAYLVYEFRKVA